MPPKKSKAAAAGAGDAAAKNGGNKKKLAKKKSNAGDNSQRSTGRTGDNSQRSRTADNSGRQQKRKADVRKRARSLENKFGSSDDDLQQQHKQQHPPPRAPKPNAKQRKRALESRFGSKSMNGSNDFEESIYITDFDNYNSDSEGQDDSLSLTDLKKGAAKSKKKGGTAAANRNKKKKRPPGKQKSATQPQRRKSADFSKTLKKSKSKSGDLQHSHSSKTSADTYPSTQSGSRPNNNHSSNGRLSPTPPAHVRPKPDRGRSVASMPGIGGGGGSVGPSRPKRGRSTDRSVGSYGDARSGSRHGRGRSMDRSVASLGNSMTYVGGEPSKGQRSRSRGPEEMSQFGGPLRRAKSRDRLMADSTFGHASTSRGFQRSRSMDHGMAAVSRSNFNASGTNFNASGTNFNASGTNFMRQPSKFHNSSRGGRVLQTSRSFNGPPTNFHDSFAPNRSMHDGRRRSFDAGRTIASMPSRRDMYGPHSAMGKSTSSGFGGPEQFRRQGSFHGPPPHAMAQRPRRLRYLRYRREDIKAPPKSLVIIWIVVSVELVLDLVTTIIAFLALVQDSECCGSTIDLGSWPLGITIPFFILILAELCFLARAIKLTLCPDLHNPSDKGTVSWLCRCLQWNAKTLFTFINFMVLINPFFGSVVAWMLLYQSDKNESFLVLGLEAASLLLHFVSIWLEGDEQTICSLVLHCVPVVPFFVSVIVILIYLNQGGVCYLVEESLFWYSGCQLCPNGSPPTPDGFCQIGNTTNATFVSSDTVDLVFGEYCSESENFCFFDY